MMVCWLRMCQTLKEDTSDPCTSYTELLYWSHSLASEQRFTLIIWTLSNLTFKLSSHRIFGVPTAHVQNETAELKSRWNRFNAVEINYLMDLQTNKHGLRFEVIMMQWSVLLKIFWLSVKLPRGEAGSPLHHPVVAEGTDLRFQVEYFTVSSFSLWLEPYTVVASAGLTLLCQPVKGHSLHLMYSRRKRHHECPVFGLTIPAVVYCFMSFKLQPTRLIQGQKTFMGLFSRGTVVNSNFKMGKRV